MTWFIEAFASIFKALFSDLGRLLGGTGTQAPVEWSEVDDELDDDLADDDDEDFGDDEEDDDMDEEDEE